LFLGYSVAAERLKKQFDEAGIVISEGKPLYVYLPCGVGGGPGGVAFGLKMMFGDNVHCFFAEPADSCCMMLGMLTGKHNEISVNDFGLENRTIADGLAVMDSTAAAMCRDNKKKMLVFDLSRPDNIYDAVMGENIGTVVSED
jgi:D-serine ammonia-lyase